MKRLQLKLQKQQKNFLTYKNHIPIKKSWGQNFLIDDNTINKIVATIDPQREDIILEINNIQVKNREQLDCELKKVTWGNKIKVKINRKNKILVKEVKTTSFEDYKKRLVMFEVKTKLIKKKFLKITHITDSSFNQTQIKKGDIILI